MPSIGTETPAFELVAALEAKSLVRQSEPIDGESRFTMLETIREYGLDLLAASGEEAAAREVHATYFLVLAERADEELFGAENAAWLRRLHAERGNLRAAFLWLEGAADAERCLRLAGALGMFWDIQGPLGEGRDWLERALALPSDPHPALRAKALTRAGLLARAQGDYDAATGFEEEGLAIWRQLGDARGIGDSLHNLGHVALSQGAYDRATELYAEAISLYRSLPNGPWAFAQVNRGIVAARQGERERAERLLEEGLAHHRATGNSWGAGFAEKALADLARDQGNLAEAARRYAASIVAWRPHNYGGGIAGSLAGLAAVATAVGQPLRAPRLFGAAEALREQFGFVLWQIEQPAYERDLDAARAVLDEATFAANWAIGRVMPGEEAIDDALALASDVAAGSLAPPRTPTGHGFTPRELDVLRLLCQRLTDKEIAQSLFIGTSTVQTHVGNILSKLGVNSRWKAVDEARRRGLV